MFKRNKTPKAVPAKKGRRRIARILSLTALSLCLCLVLTSCGRMAQTLIDVMESVRPGEYSGGDIWGDDGANDYSSRPDGGEWRTVPFSQMEYTRPDVDAILDKLEELTANIEGASNFDELMMWDYEAGALTEEFYTMLNLVEVHKYIDTGDSYYDEEYRYCDEAAVDIGNATSNLNEAILEGPFAEDYRAEVGDYVYASIQNDLRLSSDEVEEYKKERARLNADYNQQLSSLTVSYQGRDYTMDDIDAVESFDLYYQLLLAYYRDNAADFALMYSRMIELDKTIAGLLGFDSAADMYYTQYSRDYTPEQSKEYFAMAREVFTPILSNALDMGNSGLYMDYGTTFERMPSLLGQIDTELAEVWNGMIDYGLYDYEAKAGKQSGIGFTTQFYGYDASFCYGYWEDDTRSAFTAIHEFGHYYDNWLQMENDVVQNLDVAEIYSQGLEVLSFPYLGQLTDSPELAIEDNMSDMMQALTFQPLLEEFQLRIYEMDSFTAEDAGRLFTSLLQEYGYGDYVLADEDGIDNSWFVYTHLFDAPFYTISYATSACAALQFWTMSQTDDDAAVDAYMSLINSDQNRPFLEMLADAGLRSPFEKEFLYELRDAYVNTFGL